MTLTDHPATLELKRYVGREDLPAFLAFASAATKARSPLRSTWHPGDLVWQLSDRLDGRHALYGVVETGSFVAVAWFQGPGELLLDVLPSHEHLTACILEWAAERAARAPSAMQASDLRVTIFDSDVRRQEVLTQSGFRRTGPAGVQFERALDGGYDEPMVGPEIRIRDSVGIDREARAAVHRAAWSALSHIGIDATSNFTAEDYRTLLNAPVYDPRFDIVAEADNGRLVANCVAWTDPDSRTAIFEPVGVDPEFRGRRLAERVMIEAFRRLQAAGMVSARVGTAHFNAPAIASYQRSFVLADHSSVWSRRIAEPESA